MAFDFGYFDIDGRFVDIQVDYEKVLRFGGLRPGDHAGGGSGVGRQ